jgi:hypothetical protein
MAPELLAPEFFAVGGATSKAADIYALAMTAFEVRVRHNISVSSDTHRHKILTGRPPFADRSPTSVAVEVLSGKRPDRPMHPDLTDRLWDMIQRCWEQEPLRRPEISEVVSLLEHPSIVRQDCGFTAPWIIPTNQMAPEMVFPFPLNLVNDQHRPTSRQFNELDKPSPDSWSTLDGFHSVEFNGSETGLHGMRSGELDEPVAPKGLCGLLRRVAFWKQNRGTPSTPNCHGHRGILSEKV